MNDALTLTLKNDYLFKLLLGSEENKDCLQDFLECVLDMPIGMITDLELLDKELSKDEITDKTGILDVKLRLKDGTTIDIEIQNSWSSEFIPRTLFYWSKMYIEGFKEGEPYTSLTRCITINLVSQGFKFNKAVHSAYGIQEQNSHHSLTDLLELHFLNLATVKKAEIQQSITTNKQEKLINSYVFCQAEKQNFLVFSAYARSRPFNLCFTYLLYPAREAGAGSSLYSSPLFFIIRYINFAIFRAIAVIDIFFPFPCSVI